MDTSIGEQEESVSESWMICNCLCGLKMRFMKIGVCMGALAFMQSSKKKGSVKLWISHEKRPAPAIFEYMECFYVRSVQPKLAPPSEGMAGKKMKLDNS